MIGAQVRPLHHARGTPTKGTFTEAHILAITQAICDYRRTRGIDGPLHMGKDTHARSAPAQGTALEVLAANHVHTRIQRADGVTPTPVISRAILIANRGRTDHLADGIIITPSHNPPEDGGFKYNPTNGGPADTDITKWIQDRANELLRAGNTGVKRTPYPSALRSPSTHEVDFIQPYVDDLRNVVDMDAIRGAKLRLGAPLYTRIDAPANADHRSRLSELSPGAVRASTLAGEPITAKLTRAPGNDVPIGGLKVVTENGWFAARPSGTENIDKIYAESFRDQAHLDAIVSEAQAIVSSALG